LHRRPKLQPPFLPANTDAFFDGAAATTALSATGSRAEHADIRERASVSYLSDLNVTFAKMIWACNR
jgi:hypothetical protein